MIHSNNKNWPRYRLSLLHGWNKRVPWFFLFAALQLFAFRSFGQICNAVEAPFSPTAQNRIIDWQKFPEFTLPFTLVYGGPRFGDAQRLPLRYGFSHLATFENADATLPKHQRALVWYGVAFNGADQPWWALRSPWNNNLDGYKGRWQHELSTMPEVDLLVPDIERQIKSNDSILILKNHPTTPVAYRGLDNNAFITQYKKDLQALYAEAFLFTKNNKPASIAGYSDTPILNTYINIPGNSWQKWTTDPGLLNYLMYDFNRNTLGGDVLARQDFLAPSAYYYYDYPHPLAPDYLAYLLFQIEVNRAWAPDKRIIPFVWLRYSYVTNAAQKFIKPFMAEATAIFPFFSGASGLWLWDDPNLFTNNENFATYEYFIKGLHRLSAYKEMFTGNYQLVIPQPAHAYVDNRKPIWRAVVKNNHLLVVAHNPYAKDDNDAVMVEATYNNQKLFIPLKGYEIFLCRFDMNLLGQEPGQLPNALKVFPNPTEEELHISLNSPQPQTTRISMTNAAGKTIYEENIGLQQGQNIKTLKINHLPAGTYLIRAMNLSTKFIKK
ncbi:T9SS type A sorting domain-containing protein [Emticicia sp. 21SJ11W-3]|uniref:T9SS type A sorting domain-containing protein n=1 Tax=Emticicia sp. 21SJ11W-3 TaxID=2916755 RepID=UPI00209CDF0E|nr:T9SS type A sorting domain-containing protein [Emticicia sp. 21SJ11W-3]UTA66417.1 T9SS type A sorting domain-containing protein [Emticicia sp. 21SJ11W-3]